MLRIVCSLVIVLLISSSVSGEGRVSRRVLCTGYCPCRVCCEGHSVMADGVYVNRTASGVRVCDVPPAFAAVPPSVPFHSTLIVPGYNGGKPIPALDRGGAIKGAHIDLYFPTHKQALQWGKRYKTVQFTLASKAHKHHKHHTRRAR